jgi:hypothetical protein
MALDSDNLQPNDTLFAGSGINNQFKADRSAGGVLLPGFLQHLPTMFVFNF